MIRRRIRTGVGEGGFTVTEMLVAMVVIGIMTALFSNMISASIRQDAVTEESSSLQTEIRGALTDLSTELRQAYSGSTTSGPIESMNATSIQFLSAGFGNPFPVRRIGYQLSGGKFQRHMAVSSNTNGPPWTIGALPGWTNLVGSVTNSTVFTYYDSNGNQITNYANVNQVYTVTVALSVTTKTAPTRTLSYQTSVTLRTPQ